MPKTLIRLRDIPRRDIPSKDILLRRDIPNNILLLMLLNTLSLLLNNRTVVVDSWKAGTYLSLFLFLFPGGLKPSWVGSWLISGIVFDNRPSLPDLARVKTRSTRSWCCPWEVKTGGRSVDGNSPGPTVFFFFPKYPCFVISVEGDNGQSIRELSWFVLKCHGWWCSLAALCCCCLLDACFWWDSRFIWSEDCCVEFDSCPDWVVKFIYLLQNFHLHCLGFFIFFFIECFS